MRSLHPSPDRQRSAVLVAVLTVLAFLTIIVVALTVAMRVESQAANSYEANAAAEMFAEEGIEYVKASLVTATGPGVTNIVATAPGEIYFATNTTGVGIVTNIMLSSGTATNSSADPGIYKAYDLNRLEVSQDGFRAITGSTGPNDGMYVSWIYVHQSGLRDPSQTPAISSTDPIIGRFAYWADDESSRINVNSAWGAGSAGLMNTNGANHPTRVSLTNLFGATYATEIYTNATNAAFNSPDDAGRLDPNIASIISTNRFSLTHATYSPNLNPFGQPKIVLTTQSHLTNGTGSTNYLQILAANNTDPGPYGNLYPSGAAAYDNTVSNIVTVLSTPLPAFNNRSFANKYDPGGLPYVNTTQLAVNIVDYVRSVESTNAIVEGIRANLGGTGSTNLTLVAQSGGGVYFSVARHPLLIQMAAWVATTQNADGTYPCEIFLTLYLPPHYGSATPSVPIFNVAGLTLPTITNACLPGTLGAAKDPEHAVIATTNSMTLVSPATSDPMTPGTLCVIGVNLSWYSGSKTAKPAPPSNFQFPLRASFSTEPSGNEWEIAPLTQQVNVPLNTASTLPSSPFGQSMSLVEINDPRVNKWPADWTNLTDNLGQIPSIWGTAATASPPQDTEANGSVATNDLYMPAANGPAPYTNAVRSVAELGHIFSGGSVDGVPWRTLRLQPTPNTTADPLTNLPPDWALLDFFMAPGTNSGALYQPRPNMTAGRININSGVLTNGIALAASTTVARTNALAAAFQVNSGMSTTAQVTAVSNIASMNLAYNGSGVQIGTNYGLPFYVSPGEIAEVSGVSDAGESSETNLQGVVDLMTAQGSVFRAYSVGQALRQTPQGQLVIQAEQYKETIFPTYNSAWTNNAFLWKNIPQ